MSSEPALWFGRIPDRWSWGPLGRHFTERRETVSDQLFTPLSVTKDGIVPQLDTAARTNDGDNRKRVAKGDFVINSRSDRKGSSGLSMFDGSVSVISTVITPRASLRPEFVHHLLRSAQFQEEYYRYGTGIVADLWSTRYSQMKKIPIPVPPVEEQQRIAEFLDRETAQIDELIAKQEQLISTLAERSAAFRFHLTTGGLEERPRSVASSSPWFPDLPEGWVMAPVKFHARTGAGAGFPLDAQGVLDELYPFLKVNALSKADDDGVIRWQEDTVSFEMASKLGAKIYPAGTCIIAKIGAALLMGRVRQLSAPSCVDNNVMALIPKGSTSPRFLYYALQNLRPDWLVNPGAVPSTSEGAVGRVQLPFPPETEQLAIAEALDVYMRKVLATERKIEGVLTVLRERRQALISAAVTGKIDVGEAS